MLIFHRADFDDLVAVTGKAGCLDIEDDVGAGLQRVVLRRRNALERRILGRCAERHNLLQVVDKVAFDAVDYLEEIRRVDRTLTRFSPSAVFRIQELLHLEIGIRKSLYIAVVRDGDGGHAPLIGPLYKVCDLGDAVHIGHLRVKVQLDPFLLIMVTALFGEGGDLHDALNR